MAKINLLPWRENLRQERQRSFMIALAVTAVVALLLVLLASHLVNRQISAQEARNSYLESEISQLDRDIARIEELERTRDNMLARKNVIERLQENRSMTVHLFNYLAQTIPEGVRLTSVRQNDDELTLLGTSQSESRVSQYMQNIEGADWLHEPELRIIEAMDSPELPDQPFRFDLRARVASPSSVEEEEAASFGGEG